MLGRFRWLLRMILPPKTVKDKLFSILIWGTIPGSFIGPVGSAIQIIIYGYIIWRIF